MNAGAIRTIAVIGAGQMGSGIAEVGAAHGFQLRLCDMTLERAKAARERILKRFERLVEKGKLTAEAQAAAAGRLAALDFEAAVGSADVVIEAGPEDATLKADLFRRAEACTPPHALLASNTSSISITWLASHTQRPGQVIGMHFMNPVPLMKLVEVVRGVQTRPDTLAHVHALAERLGKITIESSDTPGFLVNRILLPLINEACFAVQENVGSIADIDQGARLGLNHPMGPLELADLIGLDTVLAIAGVLQRELGDDKYRPATLLRNLVAAGWLGKKTGRGFYEYDTQGQKLDPPKGARS